MERQNERVVPPEHLRRFIFFLVIALGQDPRIDRMFAGYDRPGIPGASVLVIKDGEFLHQKGYGLAELLNYEDSLIKFIPYFFAFGKNITIRYLLNHQSGLRDYEELIPSIQEAQACDLDVVDILKRQNGTYSSQEVRIDIAMGLRNPRL